MGTVYKAHDTQLDRTVAIKIPKFGSSESTLMERFYREARAAATLSHPGICPVYDVGEIDGTHYISMGFIDGKPLSSLVRSGQPLAEKQAALVVRKLAIALHDAHSHGVVHRDLKPDNVMIGPRSAPIIMDFGLAQRATGSRDIRVTQGGQMLGTPAYMSPEQVDGQVDQMGPRSDIYSLGIIFYELLTGRLPYEGSVASVLAQIVKAQPIPPTQLQDGLTPELQTICLRMMAASPDDRYASMADVARDLSSWLKGEPLARATTAASPETSSPVVATDASVTSQSRTANGSLAIKAGIGAAAAFALLAAVTLFVQVGDETVRITIDDPEATVFVDGQKVRIENLGATLELTPGDHGLQIRRGDEVVRAESFTVLKGGNPVLNLEVLPPDAVGDPVTMLPTETPPVAVADPLREAVEWALSIGIEVGIEPATPDSDQKEDLVIAVSQKDQLPDGPLTVTRLTIPSEARLREEDLQHLSHFQDLTAVHSENADLGDKALGHLANATSLRSLELVNSQLTADGLQSLAGQSTLTTLRISGTEDEPFAIPDAFAESLAELSTLNSLDLSCTTLSDAGLASLRTLPLDTLSLEHCPVTASAVAAYQTSRPDCQISFDLPAKSVAKTTSVPTPTEPTDMPEKVDESKTPLEIPARFGDSKNSLERAVGWALSRRFELVLTVDGEVVHATEFGDVPDAEFSVSELLISDQVPVDDSEWKSIAQLTASLSALAIEHRELDDQALALVAASPELRSISIQAAGLSESALALLGSIETLRSLSLNQCQLTDAGIARLRNLKLKQLDLSENELTDASATIIGGFKGLESLRLGKTRVGDQLLIQTRQMSRLREIDLAGTQISDAGFSGITALRRLQSLKLDGTSVTDAGLEKIAALRVLNTLSLTDTHCSVEAVNEFRTTHSRCEVAYSKAKDAVPAKTPGVAASDPKGSTPAKPVAVPDNGVPPLFAESKDPEVRTLGFLLSRNVSVTLHGNPNGDPPARSFRNLNDFDPAVLDEMPHVQRVTVSSQCFLRDSDWDFLKAIPHAETAHLIHPSVDDSVIERLSGHQSLELLQLSNARITVQAIRHLTTLPQLHTLSISFAPDYQPATLLTDACIPDLLRIRNLTKLTISCSVITDKGLAQLATGRPQMRSLNLSRSPISDASVNSLAGMPQLQYLRLSDVSVGDGLASVLPRLIHLESVNLSDTRIGDKTMAALGRLPRLQHLWIENTPVTDAGVAMLADLPVLESITLNGTRITDNCLESLARIRNLKRAYLYRAGVTPIGAERLRAARPGLSVSHQ
jgi:Leucine-rich repeat (LRR) protein/predicted Ser/Thr protein kinase